MPGTMTPKVNGVSEDHGIQTDRPKEEQAKLILCFDGTGNQYSGDTSDTNVVKLYQKFNRETSNQYHYYQREFGFGVPLRKEWSMVSSGTTDGILSLVSMKEQGFEPLLLTSVSS